ncbi:hypothetical protein VNI00_014228 [Paramarasmius palmivorus]|uniref:Uncharacterized protein n=1 Tax=Paramarasmius palmivorus TaxID=297713 RepID=A0AAW0BVM3_9AGAR
MVRYQGYSLAKRFVCPRMRRAHRAKRAFLPVAQRKEVAKEALSNAQKLNSAIAKLVANVYAQANQLAKDFDKKPRWFIDVLFHGGLRPTRPRIINSFNAFKWLKSRELHEAGTPLPLIEITKQFKHEYDVLNATEKQMLVQQYLQLHEEDRQKLAIRPNNRARAQDVASVATNMSAMMEGLSLRAGLEGMFVLVRNTHENLMRPQIYTTNNALLDYMPLATKGGWDTNKVLGKLEAFSVAGCDVANMSSTMTAVEHANFLKTSIRNELQKSFQTALGDGAPTRIFYGNFDAQVTLKHRVVLDNWPLGKIENLSKVSSSLPPLQKTLEMLQNGECGFRRLSDEEYDQWRTTYLANLVLNPTDVRPQPDEHGVMRHPNGRRVRADAGRGRGPRGGKTQTQSAQKNTASTRARGSASAASPATQQTADPNVTDSTRPPVQLPPTPARSTSPNPPVNDSPPPAINDSPPSPPINDSPPPSPNRDSTPLPTPARLAPPAPGPPLDPSVLDPRILAASGISINPNPGLNGNQEDGSDGSVSRPTRDRRPPQLNPLLDPPAKTKKGASRGGAAARGGKGGKGSRGRGGKGGRGGSHSQQGHHGGDEDQDDEQRVDNQPAAPSQTQPTTGSRPKPRPAYRGAV